MINMTTMQKIIRMLVVDISLILGNKVLIKHLIVTN